MDVSVLGLPYIVSNGRGGWLCSVCNGGVRLDAKKCKHCGAIFSDASQAYTIYQEALEALKANPTSAELRQRALAVGRAYSALTRQSNITVYDEMAVMNDIQAATGHAAVASASNEAQPSLEVRLRQLTELRDKGLITEREWEERRQKILDSI